MYPSDNSRVEGRPAGPWLVRAGGTAGLPAVGEQLIDAGHGVGVDTRENIREIGPSVVLKFTAGRAEGH